ncbi:MAG TPA: hypothetical protein VFA99_11600, partial [Acidobacteriaceae bacterium]|nr:hypothetical protein [Acidobacteriaceae bacterium]
GYQAGLNTLYHSELPGYVATVADSTNSYNGGWGGFGQLNEITGASRSLVYLRNQNLVVYYDRADSGSNSLDKANYLVTTGKPSFSGNTASWLTRSGNQKVYWTELEPNGDSPALDTAYTDTGAGADWEIYGRIKVDAGSVGSARFLSVLQWGPAKSSRSAAASVVSTGGKRYEGALVGSSLVMFMRDRSANFTTMTYPASAATMDYIMDLAPNMPYTVSGSGVPQRVTADNAGVLAFHADGQGSITVTRIH